MSVLSTLDLLNSGNQLLEAIPPGKQLKSNEETMQNAWKMTASLSIWQYQPQALLSSRFTSQRLRAEWCLLKHTVSQLELMINILFVSYCNAVLVTSVLTLRYFPECAFAFLTSILPGWPSHRISMETLPGNTCKRLWEDYGWYNSISSLVFTGKQIDTLSKFGRYTWDTETQSPGSMTYCHPFAAVGLINTHVTKHIQKASAFFF